MRRGLPTVERTPEKPGPGPVPQGVLRSLDLAVMRRVESLIPVVGATGVTMSKGSTRTSRVAS